MGYDKNKPERDFVLRTIELAHELKKHRYNTTLQVNLLFGSVIFTKACWYSEWKRYSLNCSELPGVTISYREEAISWQVLLHCVRNGIAHWSEKGNKNVTFEQDNAKGITKLTIVGKGKVKTIDEMVEIIFDLEKDGVLNFMTRIAELLKTFA